MPLYVYWYDNNDSTSRQIQDTMDQDSHAYHDSELKFIGNTALIYLTPGKLYYN